MSDNKCSLIIATYNWPEALNLCLLSIRKQRVLPNEIIIADDGSTEETRQLIDKIKQDYPVPITHLWQEDKGFRKTIILNKCFAKVQHEYIIQIDGDVFLHPDFIKDHLKAARPNYLLQGSRVMLSDAYSKELIEKVNTNPQLLGHNNKRIENGIRFPLLSNYLLNRYKNKYPVYYARGANMSFWKKDIYAINGYNESYEGWGHEDSDLTLRLMNTGVQKSVIKFAAIVYHLYHPEKKNNQQEERNKEIMEATLKNQITWINAGLNQYL